jgi:anti-sigma-K factor RskA
MTEDFNTEAFHYLLDELDAESRANFEAKLARDPAARAALKACADAVASFVCETAPSEAIPPADQRATLTTLLKAVAEAPRARRRRLPWKRLAWPLAASLLIGFGLSQFFHPVSTETHYTGKTDSPATSERPGNVAANTTTKAIKQGEDDKTAQAGLTPASPPDQGIAEELRRLEKLRSEYADLQRSRDAVSAEYDSIIRQLAQRALIGKGVGRLTAMELVDANSYARGERKGLVDIARGLLTEPGIVAVTPVTPSPVTPPTVLPNEEIPEPGPIATAPGPSASSNTVAVPKPNSPPPAPTPKPPPATTPEGQPQTGVGAKDQPYAWSVYDESAGRGYLNLYNLPTTTADQSLQLWVRVADSNSYQSVGEVPAQFYGGSGSLYYTLPDTTQLPVEILITKEPKKAVPIQPAGPTVLRGP